MYSFFLRGHSRFCLALISLSVALTVRANEAVEFNRDVRPILSENCFYCHGQDASHRAADLRLDTEEGQRIAKAVVPGDPQASLLIAKIEAEDPDEAMPPVDSNRRLTPRQKAVLRQWIAEGAKFQPHWSLQPIRASSPPPCDPRLAPVNAIDHFVWAKLESLGMRPSLEADRETLIRRLSFDLVGVPPTLAEIEAFLSDRSPEAYERVVDRLLQSPRYGERMALPWLDAARYADTHGYQKDNLRTMWGWRDWVIDAFNSNMPFDRFTIEQLAGDLLPHPSLSQQIATGFHRNHRINAEAGAIDEEFRVENVADRVETTSTVWLGMTVACARCHDHKFDPISQEEYYQLFAFFNNIAEKGVDGVEATAEPSLTVPVAGYESEIAMRKEQVAKLDEEIVKRMAGLQPERAAWESDLRKRIDGVDGSFVWRIIEPSHLRSEEKMKWESLADHSILASGNNPLNDVHTVHWKLGEEKVTEIRLEVLPHPSHTGGRFARSFDGNFVLSRFEILLKRKDQPIETLSIRKATANDAKEGWPIEAALDDKSETGWATDQPLDQPYPEAVFVLTNPIRGESEAELMVRLRYESKEEQSMIGRFRLSTTERSERQLVPMESFPASLIDAIRIEPTRRSSSQVEVIDRVFRERSPRLKELRQKLEAARESLDRSIERSSTRVMIMRENSTLRPTHVLMRGAYDKPGPRVEANVPESLGRIESDRSLNRLDLAKWLISPSHPLTARVAVNRFWQLYFGRGLVASTEDFGTQGDPPSHPELLDWLAAEFIRSGWDVKGLQRRIVTSATYRQSSRVTAEEHQRDPDNRWLARGPRFRLPAQLLRDQALSVSGLLDSSIGGPPVKPYQPDGLWEGVAGINSNTTAYHVDSGADCYRRSLYTFWKRAVPPPSMMIFDAADREVCSVRRRLTNTPLQALNRLNDVTYLESARELARGILSASERSDDNRLTLLWRSILSRSPDQRERERLHVSLQGYQRVFEAHPEQASLLIESGDLPVDSKIEPVRLAVWTTLACMILNLDEALTKE